MIPNTSRLTLATNLSIEKTLQLPKWTHSTPLPVDKTCTIIFGNCTDNTSKALSGRFFEVELPISFMGFSGIVTEWQAAYFSETGLLQLYDDSEKMGMKFQNIKKEYAFQFQYETTVTNTTRTKQNKQLQLKFMFCNHSVHISSRRNEYEYNSISTPIIVCRIEDLSSEAVWHGLGIWNEHPNKIDQIGYNNSFVSSFLLLNDYSVVTQTEVRIIGRE